MVYVEDEGWSGGSFKVECVEVVNDLVECMV